MNKKGYIYLGAAVLAFSTMEIASKFIVEDFHPLQMNFLRFLIGGLFLLPFTVNEIKKRNMKLSIKDILLLILLGICGVPISMSLMQISIAYTKASTIAVIISSNALFVAPLSYIFLKEKIDKPIMIGLVLGILGMIVIAFPSSAMAPSEFVGIMYGAAASLTFALFTVLGKKMVSRFGGLIVNNMVFLSGSIIMIPILLFSGIPLFDGISSSNIGYLLYLGIIVSAAAYLFMFKGLSTLPANRGSLVFFIKPVLAGILAHLLLHESFSLKMTAGTLFIMAGIFAIVFIKEKSA